MAAAVVVDVAVLGPFAYYGFFLGSVTDVFDALGLSATAPTLGLLVLVGLSVVTLHAIGYVVDVGRGDVEPVAWGDVPAVPVPSRTWWPARRCGWTSWSAVPRAARPPSQPATDAFVLIGAGLFKAVVIAGYLGSELVDPAFADPGAASGQGARRRAVRLRGADLRRLLGPDRHRRRLCPPARCRVPAPARRAVRGAVGARGSGTGGTPRCRTGCATTCTCRWAATGRPHHDVPQPGSHHGDGRPVVRRGLAVRGLGRPARRTWSANAVATRFERGDGRVPADAPATLVEAVARWAVTFNLVVVAWVFYRAESVGTVEVLGRIATLAPGDVALVPPLAVVVVVAAVAAQFVSPASPSACGPGSPRWRLQPRWRCSPSS